jgi:Protein of unknown function (DUF2892)
MSSNIGVIDQYIRALTGFVLIAYLGRSGGFAPNTGPLLLIAVYLYVTAIVLYCPLYKLAALSTAGESDGKAR